MPLFESSTASFTVANAAPQTRALTVRVVTALDELEALAPACQQVLDESASAEPMLSPTWLLTWWRIYGQGTGRRLHVGVFYDQDKLVGLAPLCKRRYWYRPGIPLTRLEFLGADVDEQDGVCSEYLNLIAWRGHEEAVAASFVQHVHRGAFGSWHELVLGSMNGADAGPTILRDAFSALGHHAGLTTDTQAPFLSVPESWDGYLKSLPKKKRHYLTSAARGFEAWAGSDWKIVEARTPDELAEGQKVLWDLHNLRWQEGDGIAGAFAAPRFSAFHHAYMPQLLREGKLELFWLVVRGEPIAVHYQITANQKVYYYQCGRRLDVPEKSRVGINMVALAIQRAMKQGLREFDFLGGPAFYKTQFTPATRPIVTLRIARRSIAEWLRRGGARAIDWARAVRQRFFRSTSKPVSISEPEA